MPWTLLSNKGSYNSVYKSPDEQWVMKIRKRKHPSDHPTRSVRLWKEVNPSILPLPKEVTSENKPAWIAPYIKGTQSTDIEIANALIDIFNRTGRVILDAVADLNFKTTPKKEVVCVDVGQAMTLRPKYHRVPRLKRTYSMTSLHVWEQLKNKYTDFFQKRSKKFPFAVKMTKALMFIQLHRPDIYNVDFLNQRPEMVSGLAAAYDMFMSKTIPQPIRQLFRPSELELGAIGHAQKALLDIRPITTESLKNACIKVLARYIQSRGRVDETQGIFKANITTLLFRNAALTCHKVSSAKSLIDLINQETTIQDIRSTILSQISNTNLIQASRHSDYKEALTVCLTIIDAGNHLEPHLATLKP